MVCPHWCHAYSIFFYIYIYIRYSYYSTLTHTFKGVGTSSAGPVLAGPLFLKVKTKFHFTKKQVINKSAKVIFGLVILQYSR